MRIVCQLAGVGEVGENGKIGAGGGFTNFSHKAQEGCEKVVKPPPPKSTKDEKKKRWRWGRRKKKWVAILLPRISWGWEGIFFVVYVPLNPNPRRIAKKEEEEKIIR